MRDGIQGQLGKDLFDRTNRSDKFGINRIWFLKLAFALKHALSKFLSNEESTLKVVWSIHRQSCRENWSLLFQTIEQPRVDSLNSIFGAEK